MADIQGTTMYGVTIQCKYKNASQWGNDEVLAAGEIGIELDTKKGKVGDGSTVWSELGYSMDPAVQGLITALTSRVTSIEERMTTAEGNITTNTGNITSQGQRISALEGITTISGNPAPAQQGS